MSYNDIADMAVNAQLQGRITACAAVEGDAAPVVWVASNIWVVVAAPGWGEAWAYAIASGHPPETLGSDGAVISDPMILSQVQAVRAS